MAKVKAIGQPENRSEAKAIRYLAESLPDSYFVLHNFEVTTGHGLPYEYDVVVIADYAVWHVEVKGYQGVIRGNQHQWEFENGGTAPSRRYVAPEVFRDPDSATEASDIYSLGIIFYEVITSRRPYDDIEDVIESGAETPLDQELLVSELGTPGSEDYMGAPKDAAMVITKMCHQDPAARYQSMDEIIEDMTILRDE